MNHVRRLSEFGQSPWLDFIRRGYVRDGSLARLVTEDGVKGVTSNPAIFEQAIAHSDDYDSAVAELAAQGKTAAEICDTLSIEDVREAADVLRGVYDDTDGLDGYVSLEVSPLLAHDTEGTVADAHRLWAALDRPNVMVKVPATRAGVPAIERLVADGVNINVTLLFGLERYRAVADAYVRAVRTRAERGQSLRVASVASFFVSRLDTLLDPQLPEGPLRGEAAVALSRVAYGVYDEVFGSAYADMRAKGAWTQRLLWASTSTKNPAYPKTKYVDALVGPDTVDTIPLATIEDYRAEGDPKDRLTGTAGSAAAFLHKVEALGYSFEKLADELEEQAVKKFVDPYNSLLAAIESKRAQAMVKP
ncbi:MAG: transaldolase [Fimbriimonadaceae bacterium]|nr:transaldolase [Fimbriimonadaceae bacterium]